MVFHAPALLPLLAVGVEQMKLIFGLVQVLVAFEVVISFWKMLGRLEIRLGLAGGSSERNPAHGPQRP